MKNKFERRKNYHILALKKERSAGAGGCSKKDKAVENMAALCKQRHHLKIAEINYRANDPLKGRFKYQRQH